MSGNEHRVGIIGTGFGSVVHHPAFAIHKDFKPTLICGAKKKKTKSISKKLGIQPVENWQQLVRSDDIDVVSIASPPYLHHEMVIEALKHNKHVLCEKPLALNTTQAAEMLSIAESSGLTCMVNHEFRYLPARSYIIELLRTGRIGEIYSLFIRIDTGSRLNPRSQGYNWWSVAKHGGGVLNALGSHYIDMILQIFENINGVTGRKYTLIPKRLNKSTGRMRKVTADDAISVIFEVGTAQCNLNINTVSASNQGTSIHANGSKGSLIIKEDQHIYEKILGEVDPKRLTIPMQHQLVRKRETHVLLSPMMKVLDSLSSGIHNGTSHAPNFLDGFRVQQTIDCISKSDKTRKYVPINLEV